MSTSLLMATVGLTFAGIMLTQAKVKTNSVLVHHATHNMGLKNRTANRIVAEVLGIMVLGTPFDEYRRGHRIHHDNSTFAGQNDEEAVFLHDLGFRPGVSRRQAWSRFLRTIVSPRFHAMEIARRLRMNFFFASRWRVMGAWVLWGSACAMVAHAGFIPGFVLGVLTPLFIGGNIGSFVELVSRHRWMVTPQNALRRQSELSHGRLLAPALPAPGSPPQHYVRWAVDVMIASIVRVTVVPGDLPWHHAHHTGLKRNIAKASPAWTDAAAAYSEHLFRNDIAQNNHASISAAIDAWFAALEREYQQG